jgi:hypothetical protein
MSFRSLIPRRFPAFALPLLTSCIIQTGPSNATTQAEKLETIEDDSATPTQMASGLADGKPPRLRPDAAMAYWVWQSAKGDWHVRSTTQKQVHRFQGRIRPQEGAALSQLKPTRLERGDRMRLQGQDIIFDFSTQGGEDGFDFKLDGAACVEMNLRIDGAAHPRLVVIGKTEQAPAAARFIVCP